QAAALMYGDDIEEVLEKADRRMQKAREGRQKGGLEPIKDVLFMAYESIESSYMAKQNQDLAVQVVMVGVQTGFPDLDKMTAGLHRSDLIILAARTAVGKTAFALNLATNVAVRFEETVAIFSLEMSKEQLVKRMLCAEGNIDAGRMRSGMLDEDDWPKLTMATGALSDSPIFIDDTPGITVQEIRSKCRKLKEKHGLRLIL
ncbi:DnaB-like helicase C-terminal domain-containing protein, partial [Tumebacillus flagellatus]